MARVSRSVRPAYLQAVIAVLVVLVLVAAYAGLMQLTVDFAKDHPSSTRDSLYAGIHLGVLAVAALTGFVLGKWLNGLGLAYGALFVVTLAAVMMFALFGSQALACRGHNDLLRHWSCTVR